MTPLILHRTRARQALGYLVTATIAAIVALVMVRCMNDVDLIVRAMYLRGFSDPIAFGTFRTENLLVDQTSTLGSANAGTVAINSTGSSGQEALFFTFAGSNTDGQNIRIGVNASASGLVVSDLAIGQ